MAKDVYRTRDGNLFFEFDFIETGGCCEAHIVNQPSYRGRPEGLHETHRLSSDRGYSHKICFGDPKAIRSVATAKKYAAAWAEETAKYIRTGERF